MGGGSRRIPPGLLRSASKVPCGGNRSARAQDGRTDGRTQRPAGRLSSSGASSGQSGGLAIHLSVKAERRGQAQVREEEAGGCKDAQSRSGAQAGWPALCVGAGREHGFRGRKGQVCQALQQGSVGELRQEQGQRVEQTDTRESQTVGHTRGGQGHGREEAGGVHCPPRPREAGKKSQRGRRTPELRCDWSPGRHSPATLGEGAGRGERRRAVPTPRPARAGGQTQGLHLRWGPQPGVEAARSPDATGEGELWALVMATSPVD